MNTIYAKYESKQIKTGILKKFNHDFNFSRHSTHESIVGSVVECSPATRAARVRFPDDALVFDF